MRYTPAMDGGILIVWAFVLAVLYAAARTGTLHGVWLAALGVITVSGAVGLLAAF